MATLNEGKHGIPYTLNEKGVEVAKLKGLKMEELCSCLVSEDILPDKLVLLTPSTLSIVNRDHYHRMENPIIWSITGSEYRYLVYEEGMNCSLVKQKFMNNSSSRADPGHELIFMQALQDNIMAEEGRYVPVYNKKGGISVVEGASNLAKYSDYADQSNTLLSFEFLKNHKIRSIWHDSATMAINQYAKLLIDDEIKSGRCDAPKGLDIDKWNPADMWLLMDEEYDWVLGGYDDTVRQKFLSMENPIDSLGKLNEWLFGLNVVGVSYKKKGKKSSIGLVNYVSDYNKNFIGDNITHEYVGSSMDIGKKSLYLNFQFSVLNKDGTVRSKGMGNINLRTFHSNLGHQIGMEVKSSVTNEYMSGKAGRFLMKFFEKKTPLLSIIRKADVDNWPMVRDMVSTGEINFVEKQTRDTFNQILSMERNHTNMSLLQGLILLNEIEAMDKVHQNLFIHQGVKYGKCEIPGLSGFHIQLR